MKVSVRLISKLEEMKKIEDRWNKVIREKSQTPFLFSDFINQYFGLNDLSDFDMPGFSPTFLTISVDNEVVGLSPLGIADVGIRFCRFAPRFSQPDIICENNYRKSCLKHTVDFLFRELRCQFVDLCLQADSPNLHLLGEVCRDLKIQFSISPVAKHAVLKVGNDWVDFEKSLGRDYRKMIRRIERRMNAAGSWKISLLGKENDETQVFDRILELEKRSWKYAHWKTLGRITDPSLAFFWNGAVKTALKESEFDWNVAMLELAGKDIAYSLFMKYKQSAYTCKTSFDEHYKKMYPGVYLHHAVIRELFARPDIKKIDFVTALPFHRKWTKSTPPILWFRMTKTNLFKILIMRDKSNKFVRKGLNGLAVISKRAKLMKFALYYA